MPVVCLHVRIYVVILFSLLYYSHHGGYIGWRWCYEYIHCYNLVGILDGDGDEEEDLLYWIRMAFWIGLDCGRRAQLHLWCTIIGQKQKQIYFGLI